MDGVCSPHETVFVIYLKVLPSTGEMQTLWPLGHRRGNVHTCGRFLGGLFIQEVLWRRPGGSGGCGGGARIVAK